MAFGPERVNLALSLFAGVISKTTSAYARWVRFPDPVAAYVINCVNNFSGHLSHFRLQFAVRWPMLANDPRTPTRPSHDK